MRSSAEIDAALKRSVFGAVMAGILIGAVGLWLNRAEPAAKTAPKGPESSMQDDASMAAIITAATVAP